MDSLHWDHVIFSHCANKDFCMQNFEHGTRNSDAEDCFTVAIVKVVTFLANFCFVLNCFPILLSNFKLCFSGITLLLMPHVLT